MRILYQRCSAMLTQWLRHSANVTGSAQFFASASDLGLCARMSAKRYFRDRWFVRAGPQTGRPRSGGKYRTAAKLPDQLRRESTLISQLLRIAVICGFRHPRLRNYGSRAS